MTPPLTRAPRAQSGTFLGWPARLDLDDLEADVAVLGVPFNAAYTIEEVANDQSGAPDWIRACSRQAQWDDDRFDFDLDGLLLDGRPLDLVDCGNVVGCPDRSGDNLARAEQALAAILKSGALPFVLGGDHGTTVPALRAFDGRGPITLVQIDAHLDWREEVNGVREGYSSPMRRASELPWITGMYQIGLRGVGSARAQEVRDARAWGSRLITAWDVHDMSRDELLASLPSGETVYLTIDADGLDPAVMPGTGAPVPGGLTFAQVRSVIRHVVENNRLVGMDVVEISPRRDLGGISGIVASRLILNAIGLAARAEYFGKASGEATEDDAPP